MHLSDPPFWHQSRYKLVPLPILLLFPKEYFFLLKKVKELAEGRVYSGIDAKKVGLVDAFGGFTDVIKYVENSRNLKGSRIVSYPKASSPFESLLKKIKGESPLSKELKSNKMTNEILESVEVLETFVGPQMRLPWSTSIH